MVRKVLRWQGKGNRNGKSEEVGPEEITGNGSQQAN